MSAPSPPVLVAAVGDVHGRFARLEGWLAQLEQARGRPVSLALAVGDVEAFREAEAPLRKSTKRAMPAEFAAYVAGPHHPLYFVGGNNEDFAPLHAMPDGGELAPGVHYLGRAGVRRLAGLRLAYLSGIYAPKQFDLPPAAPTTALTAKQAGYFRSGDLPALDEARDVDLMVVHEWPRGLIRRRPAAQDERPDGGAAAHLRAHRFPWAGNPVTRSLVERIRPRWLLCGHTHAPLATTLYHPGGARTHVACLDQAAQPDGAVLWIEWERGRAARAGWGVSGVVAWSAGEPWDEGQTPRG